MNITNLTMFDEIEERLISITGDTKLLAQLTSTGNIKYMTRFERERIFTRLLSNMGALEDGLKAALKAARDVRRARIRNDDQLSRMVVALTAANLDVDSFETPSDEPSVEVKQHYEDQ